MKTLSKVLFLIVSIFICGTSFLNAQVKGVVVSSQNEPLIGVTVKVENTTNGTVTDLDGNFTINATSENSLIFTYVGYKPKTIKVGNQEFLNVVLEEDTEILDELVVIGYGTVKKSDLTGAITSIKASELENTASAGIESALQGKIPGVVINKQSGQPGAAADIKIRGVGSFSSSGPLWVIDGVPQDPGVEFNMNDAGAVEILRDGSAAAIYGARAANGVVIVTTKRGKKGEAKVNFNAYVGFNNPTNLPKMLTTRQLKELRLEAWNGQGRMTEEEMLAFPLQYSGGGKDIRGYALDFDYTNTDYNWRDIIFSQGITQNYDLSFSKGTDDYNYYASFNYYDEKGTYLDTDFKRYSFRLNSDVKLNSWMSFGESIQLTYIEKKPYANSNYLNNYMRTLPFMMPYDENNQPGGFGYFPTKDADGNDLLFPNLDDPEKVVDIKQMLDKYDGSNLLADEKTTNIKQSSFNLNGNIFLKIQPIKQLTVKAVLAGGFGTGSTRNERGIFKYHANKSSLTPSVSENLNQGYGWTGQLYANYNETFADAHSLAVMLGMEAGKSYSKQLYGEASNMIGGIYDINLTDPINKLLNESRSNSASASLFGRINYDYKGKYLLMAMIRRDGYDRFGPENRWGTFPSFSGAWRVSGEDFIKNNEKLNWLTDLKIRASWGGLGNAGIPRNLYDNSYIVNYANYAWGATNPASGDQASVIGVRLNRIPNNYIKWEEIRTTDLGLDMAVLNNTLLFSFDWYVKKTTDALFKISLPGMAGLGKQGAESSTYTLNIGEIRNTGCDFEVTYRNKIGKDFGYSVSGNLGFSKNEVLATDDSNTILWEGNVTGGKVASTRVGYPIGTFFGYKVEGVFQTEEQVDEYNRRAREKGWDYYQAQSTGPGDLIYRDVDGSGHVTDDDITDIGDPWPNFTYGLNLNCNYKWLDFNVSFQGVQGNEIYNDFRTKTHTFTLDYSSTEYALNRWTGAGSTNENFRLNSSDPNGNRSRNSSWFVEDGSYLRMKNIQLGVTLPKEWVKKALLSKCRLYVSGQNLLTFTKYEGFDPEFSTGSITASGIDTGYYPQNKSVLCGVQIEF